MNDLTRRGLYALALLFSVLPLWATDMLPLVDLPQHLHLISVLHRLDNPTTLYPALFDTRGQLTPYLGYYYVVATLNWLLPLQVANKVFLSAYVIGFPLGLGFLLESLKRPLWPALLAVPFAYGDSFAWGFINYCAALPLTFFCCGLFVRTIVDAPRRMVHALWLGGCLVGVLLFHVQAFAYLGLALPLLLAMTRAPEDRNFASWLVARRHALVAVLPAVGLFGIWVGARFGEPATVEYGAPWKSWGPLLSPQNLSFKSFEQNWAELVPKLAEMLRDGTDRFPLMAVAIVAGVASVGAFAQTVMALAAERKTAATLTALGLLGLSFVGIVTYRKGQPSWLMWLLLAVLLAVAFCEWVSTDGSESKLERFRLPALAVLAMVLFLALPFDIRGYMYYLNTRFVHLAAPLFVACVPRIQGREWRHGLYTGAVACAVMTGVVLARGFYAFGEEAAPLREIAAHAAPNAKVMGLVFSPSSAVVTHPVYLHSAAYVATASGGVANFSFALTPHSPLKYRSTPPPTYPSEWNPAQFNYELQGRYYDHFLVRGQDPSRIFGGRLQSELAVVAHERDFWLVRRR